MFNCKMCSCHYRILKCKYIKDEHLASCQHCDYNLTQFLVFTKFDFTIKKFKNQNYS